MKKVKLKDLRKMVELKRGLDQCGWKDNALKQRYYELLNKVHGGVVRGIHSGYEYVVLDVGFCDHPACEGIVFISSPQMIMEHPHRRPEVGYTHLSNLEEVW